MALNNTCPVLYGTLVLSHAAPVVVTVAVAPFSVTFTPEPLLHLLRLGNVPLKAPAAVLEVSVSPPTVVVAPC